jgi:hypothetical protein
MIEEVPPKLCFKKRSRQKQQAIVDLIRDSSTGLTRKELATALNSPIGCVSVMMHQINKDLVEQGWKISSTDLQRQRGQRGAPGRRYRLVRLPPPNSG